MRALITLSLLCLALLAGAAYGDSRGSAQDSGPVRYTVMQLPSLGGASSAGFSINDRGWVAGRSNLAGNQSRHATLWRNGALTDLGTLGGPNSAVLWPVKNLRGVVTGIAQSNEPDPLNETWSCGFFFPPATRTGKRCFGFKWEDGVMTRLPTLGGTHGFATGSNNLGQTVGWAENTVHDSTCVPPQQLQFRAVIWGPGDNQKRQLRPLPGTDDTSTAATALNDFGQVVGISGICDQAVGRFSAIHSVLWDHGRPIEIGDFGGVAWNTPMAINQRGDVVGFANASEADGENFNPRAFLWTKSQGIRNLGAVTGDVTSQATGINEWRQIVGQSCDAADRCRGFLWQNGEMTDLQDLVIGDYDDVITTANDIDDLGRITGQAFDPDTGQFFAFLAKPVFD